MSAEIFDCRSLFHAKRALQAPRSPAYEVVMLEDISVAEFVHMIRGLPLTLSTQHSTQVIKKATPPDDAA